jgi:hypothetical protein
MHTLLFFLFGVPNPPPGSLLTSPAAPSSQTWPPSQKALATPEILGRLLTSHSGISKFKALVGQLLTFFAATYMEVFKFDAAPLHDPCAVALVAAPSIFEVCGTVLAKHALLRVWLLVLLVFDSLCVWFGQSRAFGRGRRPAPARSPPRTQRPSSTAGLPQASTAAPRRAR